MKDIHFNNRNNASFLLLMSTLENVDITPISVEYADDSGTIYTDDSGTAYVED